MQSPEDFELKKMLINVLVVLSKEPAVIPVSRQDGTIFLPSPSYILGPQSVKSSDWLESISTLL